MGSGAYVGWNTGANDTANCIGTTVGCGLITFRRAAALVAVFAVMGAMLQGQHVMKTISKGIVSADLNYLAVCVTLICSGFFVTLATFLRIPTSTSQAIVGGVVGIGLAVGAEVNYSKFVLIAESWVLCPVLVMLLSFGLMHLIILVLSKFESSSLLFQHASGWLAIISTCYVAYSMGANNVGNAVGPIANLNIFPPDMLLLIGGVSIALGAVTYGKKVADTIGKGLMPLDIPGVFAVQVSSALGMHLFSLFGIPVSAPSTIVGAVVGVGLVKGTRAVSNKMLLTILVGWVLTPTLAGSFSFVLYKVLKLI